MKEISAAKFKKQCLAILDQFDHDGIIVTKHGKPVARVLPVGHASTERIGSLRGKLRIHGDILSSDVRWDASD